LGRKSGLKEKWMDSSSLATRKAFKKYKIGNEYGKDHPLEKPPFFMRHRLWRTKKKPEPSCEGPGMIRPVVPGAWT